MYSMFVQKKKKSESLMGISTSGKEMCGMPCYGRDAQDCKAAATENLVIKLWLKIKSKAKKSQTGASCLLKRYMGLTLTNVTNVSFPCHLSLL